MTTHSLHLSCREMGLVFSSPWIQTALWLLWPIECVKRNAWPSELPRRESNYPAIESTWRNPDTTGPSWAQPASQSCQGSRQVSEAILDPLAQSSHQLNTIKGPWSMSQGAELVHQTQSEFLVDKILINNKNRSLESDFQALNPSSATYWLRDFRQMLTFSEP